MIIIMNSQIMFFFFAWHVLMLQNRIFETVIVDKHSLIQKSQTLDREQRSSELRDLTTNVWSSLILMLKSGTTSKTTLSGVLEGVACL